MKTEYHAPGSRFETRRRGLLGLVGGGVVAAALSAVPSDALADQVEITMWSWVPNLQEQIDLFMERNPDISVELVNAGQGGAQHMQFRNALRAGRGAPDVIQIPLEMQSTFQLIGALEDIGPLGASELQGDFVDWVWGQVSSDGAVYGIPWDSGPMAIVYRGDLFDEAGITEIPTWEDFREAAAQFRETHPDKYITSATFSSGGWSTGMFWQAGSRPFEVIDQTTIRINVNDDAAREVAQYWTELLEADLVDPQPAWNNDFYTSLDRGLISSWIIAGWGPVFMEGFTSESAGQWRAMPMPTWGEDNPAAGNWGGSSIAVVAGTPEAEAAARLAIFLGHDTDAATMFYERQFLFPVLNSILESDEFVNATMDFYGGQGFNHVFADASNTIDRDFQFSPFQDFVYETLESELGGAAANGTSLVDALDRAQATLVSFAQEQGFTVVD